MAETPKVLGIIGARSGSKSVAPFSHVDVIALRWKTLIEDKSMAGERVRFHKIKKENAADIDDENSFLLAEIMLKKRLGQ